ncbi:MAG: sigma-54 dependent transcriptional regulator [Marinilabiliales bacterium]
MKKVLVIDDNKAVLNFLKIFLLQTGKFEVDTLQNSSEAYKIIDKNKYDILLLDMDMPVVTGLDILKYINEKQPNIVTIVLTGVEDIDLAISAMKLGTYDYLLKPIDEQKILSTLDKAAESVDIERSKENINESISRDTLKHKECFESIITQDEKMLKIFHLIEMYAQTNNSILIWGESGTGKELIARAIHNISNRSKNKFVAVNAGVFANDLFASEFFGHEKGAFTGAVEKKKGLIEEADGGTLFLDEIGELSLPIQVKLLRFLQEEEFYRLGSTKNIKADVRIIAATNKNLFEEINKGNFRKDLFFRLNINSINLPPLRERINDIEPLAYHFLNVFNKKYNKNVTKISPSVLNFLKTYPFHGNVRELLNIINSAMIIETSNELKKKSLPHYLLETTNAYIDKESVKPLSLQELEKEHIRKILAYTNNNKTKAAEILGISRVNLIAKIKKYEIE